MSLRPIRKLRFRAHTRQIKFGDRVIQIHGLPRVIWHDLYYQALTMSWLRFYIAVACLFTSINFIFALLYRIQPQGIANLNPPNLWGCFFFSVETLATVGYGDMHPASLYIHFITASEIFLGTMMIALITGMTFARFSLPRSRIALAENPLIRPFNGTTTLMFRAANSRQDIIIDATATLGFLINEISHEGTRIRRIYDLKLVRERHPMFALSWTIMHVIDEESPLYQKDADYLAEHKASFILSVSGTSELTYQQVSHRHVFDHDTVRWGYMYKDFMYTDADELDHVDFSRLSEITELEPQDRPKHE